MTNNADQELRVSITTDQNAANNTAQTLNRHQDQVKQLLRSYRDLEIEGRKIREVGTAFAATGAAIVAPLIAAANEYAKRYGALEQTSRNFIAAQQAQANAVSSLGRVAAQALTPIMNQSAQFLQKVADFASAHPELVQAAVGVGTGLAAGGAALVAAGTAISTVARSAELLKAALGGGGAMGGLIGGLTKAGVTVGALAAGAELARIGLNKIGEATNNEYLAHYQLTQALKTAREIIGLFVIGIAKAIEIWENTFDFIVTTVKKFGVDLSAALQDVVKQIINALNSVLPQGMKILTDLPTGINGVGAQPKPLTPEQQKQQLDADFALRAFQRQQRTAQIAGGVANFAETGSLGPVVDNVIQKIGDGVKSFLGGSGSSGGGGAGVSPELANAFIDRNKKIADADRQFAIERQNINTQFHDAELKAERDHKAQLLQLDIDQANAEQQARENYQAEAAKAQRDFLFNEQQIAEKAAFDRVAKERQYQMNLADLASSRDVAGFINAERQHTFETQQQQAQDAFEKQQRQEKFDQENKDRADQFAREESDRKKQDEQKRAALLAQFRKEEEDRKAAYQEQLTTLNLKHRQEKQAIDQAFAVQVATIQGNYAGLQAIHDRYYSDMNAAALNFVNTQRNYLQQLYNQTLPSITSQSATSAPTSSATTAPSANSFLQNVGNFIGNIFGGGSSSSRDPGTLSSYTARGYADGGIVPYDMIAQVHRGEIIMNPAKGQSPVSVTIHNTVGDIATKRMLDDSVDETIGKVRASFRMAQGMI